MGIDINRVMRRTQRYWYEDGLAEIGGGAIFLLIGLLFYADTLAARQWGLTGLSGLGLPPVIIGGSWLGRRVVGALKMRLTYPRTGYVAYRRVRSRRLLRGAIAGAVSGLVAAALMACGAAPRAWIPALQGLFISAFFLYFGHTLGLGRFHVLAVFSVLAGGVAAVSGLGDLVGSAAYFGALGLALILSGALTLRAYLAATTPLPEDGDHGG